MAEDRGPALATVLGLFLGLAWLFVSLRIYVKIFLSKSWGADDILLIISLIFFSTYSACSLSGVHYGTGQHLTNIPPANIPRALYFWWLCELFYTVTTVFIRLSIAVFLLRICVKPIHKYIIYSTLLLVIVYSTFYFFLVLFQCSPVNFFWAQYEGVKGSCINPAVVPDASIAHSVVSFTADWVLGLLPVALLWRLKMNMRTKVSVAGLLSLGLLAGIATMIRIPYIKVLAITDDFLYATTDVAIWSTVEPGLGIVAAAGASLRPLFRSFYNLSSRGTHQNRNSRKGYQQNNNEENRLAPVDIMQLRDDVKKSGGSVRTSIKSPMRKEDWTSEENGKIHKTVEISRVEEGEGSESGTESERWHEMRMGREGRDMV